MSDKFLLETLRLWICLIKLKFNTEIDELIKIIDEKNKIIKEN